MRNNDFYLLPGNTIGGWYRVEEIVGMGATGIVLKCVELKTQRKVAVKRFFPDKLTAKMREKAYAEPRLNIKSQYLIVSEKTFCENGYTNSVMPFAEGESLRNILDRHSSINEASAVYTALCLTKACADLHAVRILSTDIKPANLIVSSDRSAKLIDLTFFERLGTKAEISLGTAPYAAPELLSHDRLLAGTDIYSVGVVLFEMLAGRKTFEQMAEELELSAKRGLKPDTSFIKKSYPESGKIIDRAIEPRPDKRYSNAKELFDQLLSHYGTISGTEVLNRKKISLLCQHGKEIRINPGKAFIGRNVIDCTDFLISEKHCEIEFDGASKARIRDAESTNGTMLNGKKLNGKWVGLKEADVIRIADMHIRVKMPN